MAKDTIEDNKNQVKTKSRALKTKNSNDFLSFFSKYKWLPYVTFFIFIFAVYGRTIPYGYIDFDDNYTIKEHFNIVKDLSNIKDAFFSDVYFEQKTGAYYRPVQNIIYMFAAQLSGENLWMYRFANIFWLFLAICMIFMFFRKLKLPDNYAFIGTLLMGVSPLFTSDAAWVSTVAYPVMTFFGLLSIITFMNFYEKNSYKYLALTMLFFLIALFSSELAILIPFFYLFIIYYNKWEFKINKLILPAILSIIMELIWYKARSMSVTTITDPAIFGWGPFIYNLRVIPETIAKFFVPVYLNVIPVYTTVNTVIGLIIISAITYIIIKNKFYRDKRFILGMAMFVAFIFPGMLFRHKHLNFFFDYLDHRTILSVTGFILILYPLYNSLQEKQKRTTEKLIFSLVFIFSLVSFNFSGNFSDPFTFFSSAVDKNPGSAVSYYSLAIEYQKQQDFEQAMDYYNEAINIQPNYYEAYNNRGNLKRDMRQIDAAMDDYNYAIKIKPDFSGAYYNRGILKMNMNDPSGALQDFDKSIQLNPNYIEAYNNRGYIKMNEGDNAGAITDFNEAIKLNPGYAVTYVNRGGLRVTMGDTTGAMKDYNESIRLKPDLFQAYSNRGDIYAGQGKFREAIIDYNRAIEINPQFLRAYYGRAEINLAMGDYASAIQDLNIVLQFAPKDDLALVKRGLAFMKSNDINSARSDWQAAAQLGNGAALRYLNLYAN